MISVWKWLGHAGQRLHDALHVHHHRLDGPGEDRQLLVQEVAGRRDALAHHHLVGGAADAGQVDALGALALGVFDQLRIQHRGDDHLAEGRLVAVDDDVDLVLHQAAQVDLAHLGAGGAEEDVGDVGGPHRAAPAVGQRGAHRGGEDVAGVLVVAHVRAVQDLDHLAVNAARGHALLLPDRLAFGRRDREIAQLAALLAELADRFVGDVEGDLLDRAPLGRDAVLGRDRVELGLIADFVALSFAQPDGLQGEGQIAAMVGVRGRSSGDGARQVACGDGLHGRAADAHLPVLGQTARPHVAVLAADAGLAVADGAGFEIGRAAERGCDARFRGVIQDPAGRRINAWNDSDFCHECLLLFGTGMVTGRLGSALAVLVTILVPVS